jgi:hypothetical protein
VLPRKLRLSTRTQLIPGGVTEFRFCPTQFPSLDPPLQRQLFNYLPMIIIRLFHETWLSSGLIVVFSVKIAIKMAYVGPIYSFCFTPVLHSYLPHRAGVACMKHVFIFTHNTIQQNSTPFFTGCSVYLSYHPSKMYKNLTWLSLLWRRCGSRASHHSTSLSSQFVPSSVYWKSPVRYWSLYNLSAFCTPALIDFVLLHASSRQFTIHLVHLISDSRY